MNGVLSATRLMKAHEVVKRCAAAKNSPVLLKAMELEAKEKLYEMNRKVSS
ncbi:hypothetical protein ACQKLM_13210 [Bacillus thuringiensis]|uniref:hypothetical protein n=1 Tax=Bacillus thuringiensis TaxID=1428 RepID=UPI003CFE34B3